MNTRGSNSTHYSSNDNRGSFQYNTNYYNPNYSPYDQEHQYDRNFHDSNRRTNPYSSYEPRHSFSPYTQDTYHYRQDNRPDISYSCNEISYHYEDRDRLYRQGSYSYKDSGHPYEQSSYSYEDRDRSYRQGSYSYKDSGHPYVQSSYSYGGDPSYRQSYHSYEDNDLSKESKGTEDYQNHDSSKRKMKQNSEVNKKPRRDQSKQSITSTKNKAEKISKSMYFDMLKIFKNPNVESLTNLHNRLEKYDLSIDTYNIANLARLLCIYLRKNFAIFNNRDQIKNNPELNEVFHKIVKLLFSKSSSLFVDNDFNNKLLEKQEKRLNYITYIIFNFGHLSQYASYIFSGNHIEYLLKLMKKFMTSNDLPENENPEEVNSEENGNEKYISLTMTGLGKLASHGAIKGEIDVEYINFLLITLLNDFNKLISKFKNENFHINDKVIIKIRSMASILHGVGELVDSKNIQFKNSLDVKTLRTFYNALCTLLDLGGKSPGVYPSLCVSLFGIGRLARNNYLDFQIHSALNTLFSIMVDSKQEVEFRSIANALHGAGELARVDRLKEDVIYINNINTTLDRVNLHNVSPEEIEMTIFGLGELATSKLEGSIKASLINKLLDAISYKKIQELDLTGIFHGLYKLLKSNKVDGQIKSEHINKLLRKVGEFENKGIKFSNLQLKRISGILSIYQERKEMQDGRIDSYLVHKFTLHPSSSDSTKKITKPHQIEDERILVSTEEEIKQTSIQVEKPDEKKVDSNVKITFFAHPISDSSNEGNKTIAISVSKKPLMLKMNLARSNENKEIDSNTSGRTRAESKKVLEEIDHFLRKIELSLYEKDQVQFFKNLLLSDYKKGSYPYAYIVQYQKHLEKCGLTFECNLEAERDGEVVFKLTDSVSEKILALVVKSETKIRNFPESYPEFNEDSDNELDRAKLWKLNIKRKTTTTTTTTPIFNANTLFNKNPNDRIEDIKFYNDYPNHPFTTFYNPGITSDDEGDEMWVEKVLSEIGLPLITNEEIELANKELEEEKTKKFKSL